MIREMNMHMPQNVLAETELRTLAAIPYQLISPTGNSPIIGIYQDSMLGSYRFTRPNVKMSHRDAMNLLMMYNNVDMAKLKEVGDMVSSFDVLSQILPPLTMKYKTKLFEDGEDPEITNNIMEIRGGQYLRGQMEKSVLGSGTKGIIHRVCNDFGNMAASNFIDDLQNVVTEYMKSSSFSVGVSDLVADKKTAMEIIQVITDQKMEVQSVIDQVHLGTFKNNTAASNMMEFETKVNNLLNKATEQSGKIGRKSLSKNNRFLMIVNSGSKGSLINISQMISCLGQQNVDGKRIPYGFDSRTLPHFNKYDDSPNARGFIENSYIDGLTAPELFFHAMGGRIGLIDTACKTSSTGYIQRRLIKGLEDLKVEYDMTVRNSKGKIVQFSYGEDGFESSKVENQFINLVEMSVEDIYMHYDIVGLNDYDNDLLLIYTKGTVSRMKKQRTDSKASCKKYIDYMIKARDDIVESVFKYKNENSIKMPVSFQNIIVNIQGQLNLNANSVVDITPLEAFQLIEEYYKKLQQIYFAPPTQLFEVMYYFYLSPRDLLVNKRFHRKALVLLLETIILKYKQSIVHPGEMVGVIAGQATGEPTTQLSILRSEKIKMVRINKNTQIPEMVSGEIGALCDNIIAQLPEYTFDTGHKESVETILEPLDDEYYIVGVDEQERTHWNKISHVSRHIVNGDMIRVTTKSGRTVETTMSHSHLVRKNQSVQPILGSDMKIGMRIPVAKHISNPFVRDSVEIAGKSYVLDHLFGWFIGAYLAEGCLTKKKGKNEANGTISISNVSEYYIENVKKFAERFDRTCRTKSKTGKIMDSEKCYTNTDTSFTYKPLADLLMQTCGTGSFVKHVPDFAFLAPDDFKAGILAGYFDGDGNFMCDKLHHQIRVCSRSNQLIKDISLLLSYFDIFGSLHKGYRNGANYYHLAISPKYAKRYEQHIGSNLHALKLKTLVEYSERTNAHSLREDIDKINGLGEVIASCGKKLELPGQSRLYGRWEKKEAIGRSTLEKYIELFQYHDKAEFIQTELSILRQAATSSVIWDEIVEIERYTPEQTEYVYDFTVPGNQTFMTDYAVIVHNTLNTFHLSGVASKSNVTRGVPRIEEILRLTKNPKNPSLTIHLKPFDEQEQDKAVKFANMIEHTKLIDLVKSVQICFDPNDSTTFLPEDTLLLEQFYEFEKLVEECNETTDEVVADGPAKSRWIIRMEFNAELLLDKNITMDDIHFAIKHSHYGNEINCVYSDYNMDKLIFRIRVNSNIFSKTKKRGVPEPLDQSDEIYLLKNFQDTLLNNIVMRGIRGIVNVIPRKLQNMVVKEDGKFARKDTWILDTTGTNLLETLALDFIDSRRTFSNDIKEIFNVFGIEAARQTIYNEFVEVMEFADVYINYHHLSLLCDRMTNTKDMVSIFRSGILNDDIGPVSKSTFEVHTEVLLNAARHAELDHMRGVSATVMMGQYGYYGTNAFNLVMDLKEMQKLDSAVVDISDKDAEIEKMFNIKATENDACSKSAIETKNNIANIKRHDTGGCDDDYNMGF